MKIKKRVAVAGASGFVGTLLVEHLSISQQYDVVALSRKPTREESNGVTWLQVDLFSYQQISEALKGIDCAIYLVHSMMPTANLEQGDFADYDLLLADNFARSCKQNNVQQVVYLGGLLPKDMSLSTHLESRLEVEKIFVNTTIAFTSLRAGLILGGQGSSFNIMYNLVRNLPVLVCPSWSLTKITPVYVDDVVEIMTAVILKNEHFYKIYDLGSDERLSYFELLKILAEKLKLRRIFLRLPFTLVTVSRLWVSYFSKSSRELVYPLLDSLSHEMVVSPERRFPLSLKRSNFKSYAESLDCILLKKVAVNYKPPRPRKHFVRSIQRFAYPHPLTMAEVADEYMNWLPKLLFPILKVIRNDGAIQFCLLSKKFVMLELILVQEWSQPDRKVFSVAGGVLAHRHSTARIEFRSTLDGKYLLAAIHDFKPSLPWYIYKYTQAFVHAWIMGKFGQHLSRISAKVVRKGN